MKIFNAVALKYYEPIPAKNTKMFLSATDIASVIAGQEKVNFSNKMMKSKIDKYEKLE